MKLDLRSKWWTAGVLLAGTAFIGWIIVLSFAVNKQQEKIRENVGVIGQLMEMEEQVLQMRDTSKQNLAGKQSLKEAFRENVQELKGNETVGTYVQRAAKSFAAIDSMHAAPVIDRWALVVEVDTALSMLGKATKLIRQKQGAVSASLSTGWDRMEVFVIISCVFILVVFFLLQKTRHNINRRIAKEREATSMNVFLDAVLEHIPNMVFIKEAKELRFVRFNKAGEELLGYSRDELLGKNDYDFFPPAQADFFTAKDREVLAKNGETEIPEEVVETKYKGRRWLHTRKIPLSFEKGDPQFILGVSEDITELKKSMDEIRRFNELLENKVSQRTAELEGMNRSLLEEISVRIKAEKMILENERRYERLINTIGEGIMHVDNEDRIQFVNRKFCEMMGYAEEELLGKKAGEVFLDEHEREKMSHRLTTRNIIGGEDRYEVQMKKKSGEPIMIYLTGVPVRDESGKIIGSMGTHLDITHVRNTEQKLLQKIRDLDMFFYRSSHDLKGPLASMQGLLMLAQGDVRDGLALHYLGMLRKTADKLDKILLGLIEVINATQGETRTEEIDLGELVENIVEGFSHLPERSGITIRREIGIAEKLMFDKSLLRSVLQNLIHNAIIYRKKDRPDSFIAIRAAAENGKIRISVQDNGVGIPKNVQERVFDVFFRANEDSPGSGLGLYIARNALEKLSGTISLESEQGKGSTFIVVIPGTGK